MVTTSAIAIGADTNKMSVLLGTSAYSVTLQFYGKVRMSRSNFYRRVDRDGNMPILSDSVSMSYESDATHPYFIQYRDNKPIAYKGEESVLFNNGRVWDYSVNKLVDASDLRKIIED